MVHSSYETALILWREFSAIKIKFNIDEGKLESNV